MRIPRSLDNLVDVVLSKSYPFLNKLDTYIQRRPIRSILYFGATILTANATFHFAKDVIHRGPRQDDIVNAIVLAGCGYAIKTIFDEINSQRNAPISLKDIWTKDMSYYAGFVTLSSRLGVKYLGKEEINFFDEGAYNKAFGYFGEILGYLSENGFKKPEQTLEILPLLETGYLLFRAFNETKVKGSPKTVFGPFETALDDLITEMEKIHGYRRHIPLIFSDNPISEDEYDKMIREIKDL